MRDLAARLALSPLLAVQALRVVRGAQRLPEAAGPRAGRRGRGAPLRLLILGDSSAAGVGVADQAEALSGRLVALLAREHEVRWRLDAKTGATTASTLKRLARIDPWPCDVAVIALGVNDATRLVPVRRWCAQQSALLDMLQARHTPRRTFVSGVPPLGDFPLLPQPLRWTLGRQARSLDAALAGLAASREGVVHVPFSLALDPGLMAADGFHPGAPLYRRWAEELAPRIIAAMTQHAPHRTTSPQGEEG
jgi:lysophospholipase L1-like esterase